jgi:hypothetical protein
MGFHVRSSVDVMVAVLGWPRVVRLELPIQLLEPMVNPCPPDTIGLPGTPLPSPSGPARSSAP